MQTTRNDRQTGTRVFRTGKTAWYALLSLCVISCIASSTWGFDEAKSAKKNNVGLRGLLPAAVPDGLSAEAFGTLDGNWKEWGESVAGLVTKFYEDESLDVAGQRQLIVTLQAKLNTMEKALADQRYRSLFDPLTTLHIRLISRVEVSEAVLDTLELDPKAAKTARLNAANQKLAKSLRQLEAYLKPMKNGDGWLAYVRAEQLSKLSNNKQPMSSIPMLVSLQSKFKQKSQMTSEVQRKFLAGEHFVAVENAVDAYLAIVQKADKPAGSSELRTELAKLVAALENYETSNSSVAAIAARSSFNAIRDIAPDGGELIADALRSHYFNYNVRVAVSEAFINRFMTQKRRVSGPVDDFILGAKVDGTQTTDTIVVIDLLPSNTAARFNLTLNGVTQSTTTGNTGEAVIYTSGYHTFISTKEVTFDGDIFRTHPARISVNANNTTTGATTSISNVLLFGNLADSYAVGEARRRRGQTEAIAVQRVSSRVLPEFNKEVDKKFSTANAELEAKVDIPLKQLNLFLSAESFRTTDNELLVNTRLMTDGELSGGAPNSSVTAPNGLVVSLHESWMNNAIDRMNLAGRTVTDKEMRQELEKSMSTVLGRDYKFPPKPGAKKDKDPTTFIFPESDPVRIQIDDGKLKLTIRTGLKQKDGKEDIPTQKITVSLSFKVEGDNLHINSSSIAVSPVERPKSNFVQIARAGIVRKKIKAAFPDRIVSRYKTIERDDRQPVKVAISDIKALGGWLSLVVE